MKLNKIKLGKHLELYSKKCNIPNLRNEDVSGVNKDKEFFEPSNQVGSDTSKYKIVPPKYYACNLMHVGRDVVLPIAYNHSPFNKIVSPAYQVFRFKENKEILSEYFFLYLKSSERDRYFWFNTDSSVRDGLTWDDMCDIDIELPSTEIQQKYVNIYNSLVANQQSYERGLDDLKLVCDAFIEELRRRHTSVPIKKFIRQVKENNKTKDFSLVKGVDANSSFIDTKANMQGVDTRKYIVVRKENIAFNPSRINLGSIAIYDSELPCVVSPMYCVFEVVHKEKLLPEYLMLWLSRKEFQRYTWFYSAGSVRDTFDFNLMQEVKIPIPTIEVQKNIVKIFNSLNKRRSINEKLNEQIKEICPILIKGAIEEATKGV